MFRMVLCPALAVSLLVGVAPSAPALAGTALSPAVQVADESPKESKKSKNGIAGAANSLVTDVGSLLGGGKNKSGKGKGGKGKGKGDSGKGDSGKGKGKGKGGSGDGKTGSGKHKGHKG